MLENDTPTDGPIGTKLRWSHPNNTSTSKPLLVVIANRTVHALCGFMSCFMGCNGQKNIHTFDETLSLYATMLQIISGKKQEILIQKPLDGSARVL